MTFQILESCAWRMQSLLDGFFFDKTEIVEESLGNDFEGNYDDKTETMDIVTSMESFRLIIYFD